MRRYLVFAVVCLALMLASIGNFSAAVALPVIMSDLNTTIILAGWVLAGYGLVQTMAMPLAGKLSEMLGNRIMFLLSALFFTTGSVLSALAPDINLLIGARAIQAIGGGSIMPCAAGIVSDNFPDKRQRYIGLFSSVLPIGMIVGPNVGGWLAEAFGWRAIFWMNVPIGVALAVLTLILLPGDRKSNTKPNIDFIGAGLLFSSLFAVMFGLTELGHVREGVPWEVGALLIALGVVLIYPFLRWEGRAKEPIIDLQLLTDRPFLAANIFNLVYGMCTLSIRALIPLYAVILYKMSTLESGMIMTPWPAVMMGTSIIASFSLPKWGYRWPMLAGVLFVAVALVLLAMEPHGVKIGALELGVTPVLALIIGLCGIGNGVASPAANNACIELLPDKVATISGLRAMFRNLGSAMGVAIAVVVLDTMGNGQQAFRVVLLSFAGLIFITIPTILIMPVNANVKAYPKKPAKARI
ncbi:MAG: MFS transporter [Dehalococcoidales bacterium]|nr:MFS transporter [Dehalococcoidales bacterium]